MDKVILIRTISGEVFIGCEKQSTESVISLTKARNLAPQATQRGVSIAAAPVCPFSIDPVEDIEFPKEFVLVKVPEEKIIPQILNGYKSDITGLDLTTAAKPEIIT